MKTIPFGNSPQYGRWREVLTGSDVQGRFASYQDGRLFERGFYALGKRHQFVIWSPTGPCAGVGYGVYRWYLDHPSPTRRRLGFIYIRDACESPGAPGKSYWSDGPPFTLVR